MGALRSGLALLAHTDDVVVVTVVEPADPILVTGTGLAGGTMDPSDYEHLNRAREDDGERVVTATAADLGIADARTAVLSGLPGPTLCAFADEVDAGAIVIGTRGNGGFKRAVLGSVSDYVVRNAPCPVIVTGAPGADS
jgi:nucleotide-binding universal stress UspA family protein